MRAVTIGYVRHRKWPLNCNSGIVDIQRALGSRCKVFGVQVQQFAIVLERLESVRTPFGDEQRAPVGLRQNLGTPLEERFRSGANVDDHIEDAAAQARYDLHLRMRRMLKMQTAYGALAACHRVVDLHDALAQSDTLEFVSAKHSRERSAKIARRSPLYDVRAGDAGRAEIEFCADRGTRVGRAGLYHVFHGAAPPLHSSSRRFLSRSVSIGCQKPRCSNAMRFPSPARRTSGSSSQLVSSPEM